MINKNLFIEKFNKIEDKYKNSFYYKAFENIKNRIESDAYLSEFDQQRAQFFINSYPNIDKNVNEIREILNDEVIRRNHEEILLSFESQIMFGKDLSEKQLNILNQILKKYADIKQGKKVWEFDQEKIAVIEKILELSKFRPSWSVANSILLTYKEKNKKTLTEKQYSLIVKGYKKWLDEIENPSFSQGNIVSVKRGNYIHEGKRSLLNQKSRGLIIEGPFPQTGDIYYKCLIDTKIYLVPFDMIKNLKSFNRIR